MKELELLESSGLELLESSGLELLELSELELLGSLVVELLKHGSSVVGQQSTSHVSILALQLIE